MTTGPLAHPTTVRAFDGVRLRAFEEHDVEMAPDPGPTLTCPTIGTPVRRRGPREREGMLRSHQEIGGRRVDTLLHATIRPE
ncbi:hypothetical protein [Prauserella endophytica]|uniref:hypothetical protein n=1 Tax=Prauserella endophytica TaxID=1592324 RepID=UPI001E3B0819|nr:hypothetical protein [Prauserella endophytica]